MGLVLVFGSEGEMIKRDDPQHLDPQPFGDVATSFKAANYVDVVGFMPVVWRLYQARMWLLNLQGIVVINKPVRFVDGCWCGWG